MFDFTIRAINCEKASWLLLVFVGGEVVVALVLLVVVAVVVVVVPVGAAAGMVLGTVIPKLSSMNASIRKL